MPLPININNLINGLTVEWERIEFKRAWNPESILHSMCAFANDINNWGGGYIIVGIEVKDGKPILPPHGTVSSHIDAYQKKLLELCHKITPNYFPVALPNIFEGKQIFILWCPGGDGRPYKAAKTLGKNHEQVFFCQTIFIYCHCKQF
jgi:ATP-dependent DNA helicase RecG